MKRRTKVVALATSLLVGVSMMGVGFAAWVISNNAEATATGNITAEAIKDEALTENDFKITDGASGTTITYGVPENANVNDASHWLHADSATKTELLTHAITFSVSSNVNTISVAYAASGSNIEGTEKNGWDLAVERGYVGAISYSISGQDVNSKAYFTGTGTTFTKNTEADFGNTNVTITITVQFTWGSHFGGQNPYEYYAGKAMSDSRSDGYSLGSSSEWTNTAGTYKDDALASLQDLETILNNVSYSLKFTAAHA